MAERNDKTEPVATPATKRYDCKLVYTCTNNEGTVENREVSEQLGLDASQRVVFEAIISKHIHNARLELLKMGLLNAKEKGRVTDKQAQDVMNVLG